MPLVNYAKLLMLRVGIFYPSWPISFLLASFFFLRFYLFIHERESETQAEGEAGSMQGALRGTRSQVSRITPWAEGGTKPLSHWVALFPKSLCWPEMGLLNVSMY